MLPRRRARPWKGSEVVFTEVSGRQTEGQCNRIGEVQENSADVFGGASMLERQHEHGCGLKKRVR